MSPRDVKKYLSVTCHPVRSAMSLAPDAPASGLEFELLNRFQRDFPLLPRPFAWIGEQLGIDEATVIDKLQAMQARGWISRVGAVFRPNAVGASALAALSVPPARLDEVADLVSGYPEINHNYEREHRFNLWFVATADAAVRLQAVLQEIEAISGCGPMLVLPMLEGYHIDLGFDLTTDSTRRPGDAVEKMPAPASCGIQPATLISEQERALVGALQDGLAFVDRPFAALGCAETEAIATLAHWLDVGVVKRFGVIVRHHEVGFTSNAMVVWDVPDAEVSDIGQHIARSGLVTLCYRRPRQPPHWPYNLFCMMHGRDRAEVEARIVALAESCALGAYPRATLFSSRRFKQRGACYTASPEISPEATDGRD